MSCILNKSTVTRSNLKTFELQIILKPDRGPPFVVNCYLLNNVSQSISQLLQPYNAIAQMRTKKNWSSPLGVLSLDKVLSQRERKTSTPPPSSVFIGAVSDLSWHNLRGIL